MEATRITAHSDLGQAFQATTGEMFHQSATLADLLRRPGIHYTTLHALGMVQELDRDLYEGVEISLKYAGYIERQTLQIARLTKYTDQPLLADLNYMSLEFLSKESREKLTQTKPLTIGQASRIGGVSPADVNALLVYLQARKLSAATVSS
jgi:tRNA uridine 5-carboxymethylaminomethyl modification enzyme